MAPLELQITIHSAKDLKNVNWRYGDLRPYAVVWVDPKAKCSTRVDDDGDTCPVWDETLTIPLRDRRIDDSILFIDIVHANADENVKPLIGSARFQLREIVETVGFGEKYPKSLKLKRPSGRPQGKMEVTIMVREPQYYGAPAPAPGTYVPPYGQGTRDYQYGYAPPPQPTPYGAGPPQGYSTAPPQGYPYNAAPSYGQPTYGQPAYSEPAYGAGPAYGASPAKKGSKFGVGTGLAVGAVAGVLGGLALAEGVDYVEDKIADDAADKVEDDLGYDDGDYDGDDY
ncbi:calcium-dependent lipid-binding (CaLB domain) family protein [Tasmannia lanceolata]|uniref:calcium-dependent lipid-binding (CaLB domain) family protein n=1 Tax=Tasmannia lanceolata TaxID=3420 RepID=UPI004062BE99